MDFQFYPTPKALAERLWAMFKNRDFIRVLEPSAGNADLAKAAPWRSEYRHHSHYTTIDCCEIDVTRHALLREAGCNIVGLDFMNFGSGSIYSHIVMNPPFAAGAAHVLKAWEILWDGEIVAIINADTLRNPHSQERKHLLKLIALHGEVEYVEGAFQVPDAERKAAVDVALVYLRKEADAQEEIYGDLLAEMREDASNEDSLARGYEKRQELALPNTTIENAVVCFKAAVRAMQESVRAEAKSNYYTSLLGDTMAVRNGNAGKGIPQADSIEFVKKRTGSAYEGLKDRAWTSILRSSNFTSKLSSKAQQRVEKEFESIKKLEFSTSNIYGFLLGIVESQGQIQIEMCCDVFDSIVKYHTENTVYFRGWKSNSAHRTCGMRIKTTRFIIPGHKPASFSRGMDYESMRMLSDFDKVFALVDGKTMPDVSLQEVFDKNFTELCHGKRCSSSYFDVRLHPGIGTIHFFPRDKKLVDRFNRLVGRHRRWLPQECEKTNAAFEKQFDDAEKLDKEFRAELSKVAGRSWYDDPLRGLFSSDAEMVEKAQANIDAAASIVQLRHGINVDFQLEDNRNDQQQLLLAA